MAERGPGGPAEAPIITTRGLTKRFRDTLVALDDLDLEVQPGIALAVLGPRGAGKTTLVRLLSGLARPTAGTATLGDATVGARGWRGARRWLAARRRLGVMLDDPTYHAWMTGREVVAFAAQLAGLSSSERHNRVDETLGRVGLTAVASDRVATYSSPLRRRLGLAQAIVGRPEIVLLDEPVASLAGLERDELLAVVAVLSQEATVLYTTAEVADIERIADRVALLDAGRLVLEAPVADLLRGLPAVYAIEAERDQAPAIAALDARLRQEPWVAWTAVETAGLRVAVSEPARATRDLLPLVVAAGVRVIGFGRRRPTLEDLLAERSRRRRPEDRAA